MSGDESEAGDGEESVAGVGGQDASSTATIGSNLLYLSDEQVSCHDTQTKIGNFSKFQDTCHFSPLHRIQQTMMIWTLLMMPRCLVTITMTMM